MSLALLLTAVAATAVGAASLCAVRALRSQITVLQTDLVQSRLRQPVVPAARTAPDTEGIREAVAEALAQEREREMAEARAFWAAQEARDAAEGHSMLGGLGGFGADELYLPRQVDFVGLEPVAEPAAEGDEPPGDSPELAAARRRHPSHPDFVPTESGESPAPVDASVPGAGPADHERTVACLEELAQTRTALADVRPGPLGTLDVYVFTDGTTLCMTPGHRETAEQLAAALESGQAPVLLGGSGVSGAYALTFACGGENVYILADRVIASI